MKRIFILARILLLFCTMDLAAGAEGAKHSVTLQSQDFDDETVVSQSFSRTGLTYRYQLSQKVGLDLEFLRINGDLDGNFFRLGASGSVTVGRAELNYGLHHYEQKLDNSSVDSSDSGLKLMLGLGFDVRQFRFDLNYYSEDIEGAHPDDPGDYVEMGSLELNVRYQFENSPWSLGFSHVDSGSDYTANTLAIRFNF